MKLQVTSTDFEGLIDLRTHQGFNVSEIDESDDGEIRKFFDEEYLPNYDLVKQAMIHASADSGTRYFFSEPTGCSRLYGVYINTFEPSDMISLIRAMLAVDCFQRESAFGANLEYTDASGNKQQASLFYIARNSSILTYPSHFGTSLQQAIEDFRC